MVNNDDDDDYIDDIEFDDEDDLEDDNPEYNLQEPQTKAMNARRELEKRLEMKRLREQLEYDEFDDDI